MSAAAATGELSHLDGRSLHAHGCVEGQRSVRDPAGNLTPLLPITPWKGGRQSKRQIGVV